MQIRMVLFLREAGLDMTVDRRGLLFTSSFTSGLERHVTVRDIILFISDLETCYSQGYTPLHFLLHFRPREKC